MLNSICPKCGSSFDPTSKWGPKKYCSPQCSHSRGPRTEQEKENIRNKLSAPIEELKATCVVCDNVFIKKHRYLTTKTCSKQCADTLRKTNANPNKTQNRGCGRGKAGWYKGFYLNSVYELAYLIYCLDHNISISRNTEYFIWTDGNDIQHRYYPDFIVNGELVEIKGFWQETVSIKLSAVTKPIKILYHEDLLDIFKYVEQKTNIKYKQLHVLYDK